MLSLVVSLLVLLLVIFLCKWIIDVLGVPEPIKTILYVLVAVLAIASLLAKIGVFI